jgi:hypothetical protein
MTRRLAAKRSLEAVLLMALTAVLRCAPPAPGDTGASERAALHGPVVPGELADERGSPAETMKSGDTLRLSQPGMLRTVEATPVVGWTGPGGEPFEVAIRTADPTSNMRSFGSITLRNSARTRLPDLGQYPCTSCHLGRSMLLRDERIADAHQNIQPLHPAQTGATCSTCHAADNVERLALRSGDRASLDHCVSRAWRQNMCQTYPQRSPFPTAPRYSRFRSL